MYTGRTFEFKTIYPLRDRSNQAIVQLLIERLVLGRGDEDEFPFEVFLQGSYALERDAEFVRVEEAGGVVEPFDVLEVVVCSV
jgi:hypothetical protein